MYVKYHSNVMKSSDGLLVCGGTILNLGYRFVCCLFAVSLFCGTVVQWYHNGGIYHINIINEYPHKLLYCVGFGGGHRQLLCLVSHLRFLEAIIGGFPLMMGGSLSLL